MIRTGTLLNLLLLVQADVLAVGCVDSAGPVWCCLIYRTGAATKRFGEVGPAPGQLHPSCTAIRLTQGGSHVIVTGGQRLKANHLSMLTTAGLGARCALSECGRAGSLAQGCAAVCNLRVPSQAQYAVAD